MKFDVVIIGGGLSGLVCGNLLQKSGKKCAIISAGENSLHFSSGYFGLMDRTPKGEPVGDVTEIFAGLPGNHPYSKIGREKFEAYCSQVKDVFAQWGITLGGDPAKKCFRITPFGELRPSWLALEDFEAFPCAEARLGEKAMVVNIPGFLDFNAGFIASNLEKRGTKCRIVDVAMEELSALRKNPSEMRSTNIAKLMDASLAAKFASAVQSRIDDEDAVILPAVFGMKDSALLDQVRSIVGVKTVFAPTMMPSVPGIRTQFKLKRAFELAGGIILKGDRAVAAEIEGRQVKSVETVNFGSEKIYADTFVLATGKFFSKGLVSTIDKIEEPVFGLDIDAPELRADWADENFFKKQAYLGCGVCTDEDFRAMKGGLTLENLHAIGSICGAHNPIAEGSGSAVDIFSAMKVVENIIKG